MNDNELDTMLREHGATWREDHRHRAALDWAEVTGPKRSRRTWIGLLAIAATAAAVVLPLVLVSGSKPAATPSPAHTPHPLTLKAAERGAPQGFFGIAPPTISGKGGAVAFVVKGGYEASNLPHLRAVAEGTSPDGYTAYAAYPTGGCTSRLEKYVMRLHYKGAGLFMTNLDVATVPAVVARTAMVVSPDGMRLAFSTDQAPDSQTGHCTLTAPTVDVLNLKTKKLTTFTAYAGDAIESLAWAPDSRHLAFELISEDPSTLAVLNHERGAYVIDTASKPIAHVPSTDLVTPLHPTRGGDGLYAPVLYLRGRLAVVLDGAVRAVLADGRLGRPLLTGLPTEVLSASIDPTGEHILMVTGPFASTATGSSGSFDTPYSNRHQITTGTTYRWDRGLVTKVKGTWLDPAW